MTHVNTYSSRDVCPRRRKGERENFGGSPLMMTNCWPENKEGIITWEGKGGICISLFVYNWGSESSSTEREKVWAIGFNPLRFVCLPFRRQFFWWVLCWPPWDTSILIYIPSNVEGDGGGRSREEAIHLLIMTSPLSLQLTIKSFKQTSKKT